MCCCRSCGAIMCEATMLGMADGIVKGAGIVMFVMFIIV